MERENTNNLTNNQIDDDTTFNKLKNLQKLLKKESAVRELFLRMNDETQKSIEKQCIDIYKKNMEVLAILQKIQNEKPINKNNSNSKQKSNNNSKEIKSNIKEYSLVETNYDYLSDLNTFITNILKYLWEEPKLIANLLMRTNKDDTKKYIAPLICNNFYENILSSNYIEDPLLYIIYLLLKQEINSIKSLDNIDAFLNDTQCVYLLGQLIEKNDVKEFFKIILQNTLEDLVSDKFIFSSEELASWQQKRKKTVNKSIFEKNFLDSQNVDNTGRKKTLDKNTTNMSFKDISQAKTIKTVDIQGITDEEKQNIKNNINYQVFTSRYLKNIALKEIEENIKKYNDDIWLKTYYEYILLNANDDKKAYFLDNFTDKISNMRDPESILFFYQENFIKVMDFCNQFFKNFIDNYRIVPYALKCVCKIIYQLVTNKFSEATIIQKCLFISKFFFKILVFPILQKPDINALINNYIISNNTLYNMKIISDILWKLVNFKLYKNDKDNIGGEDYAPFNQYFLEVIPEILKIYKIIIDVNLPHFINGLIDKSINEEEYVFNYFNENPNEISFYQSTLLNIKTFNALFLNLLKYKDKLIQQNTPKTTIPEESVNSKYSELKKKSEKNQRLIGLAIDKIKSPDYFKILTDLVNKIEYTTTVKGIKREGIFSKKKVLEEKKETVKYFHISRLLFNESTKKILSLDHKKHYQIRELKDKDGNKKDILIKNNIIKCKNFLSSILYNYRILIKSDFGKGTTHNTMDILKELSYFMKASNYLIDGTIPSEWYCVSLMECLKKLPDDYKKNEYEKLFDELTSELNESIKICNFDYMSMFLDQMKFGNRNKAYFEKVKGIYMDIELNNKANNIIENDVINITLYHKLKGPNKEFFIYQEGIKEKQLEFLDSFTFESKYRGRLCKTIEQFAKAFPNLNKYVQGKDNLDDNIEIFELQKQLDIPNKLTTFFNMINTHLKSKFKNENEINIINDKIYDYVMSRICFKIYPKVRNIQDQLILDKTCQLNWIEPEYILKDNVRYDFDFVLPDINTYFKLIRTEKSPRKKIINLNNIFLSINKLLKFTKGDVTIGVDDQMPLLTYCFIKARPWGIFTDSYLMKLYIGNKKNKNEDNELSQLLSICDFIIKANAKSFNGVSEIEFNEKSVASHKEAEEYINKIKH